MATSTELSISEFDLAVEAAKLRALYNFAYGLSHEINNPLANIATRAQTLLADEKDPERRRKLATIVQQAFRAHEMIADLMLFAHPPQMQPRETNLLQLVDAVISELHEQAKEQNTRLTRVDATESLTANVDPTAMAAAIKAIIQNALEAVQADGAVEIRWNLATAANDLPSCGIPLSPSFPPPHPARHTPHFLLTITDTGPGIPAEIRPNIFDPFYSGREAGRGLGLGLSKAWRIVDLHGGRIEVESEAGQGATFRVILPCDRET